MYHVDGIEALKFVDSILEISELNAIQWNPNYGLPGVLDPVWFSFYDKVRKKNKSLWLGIYDKDLKNKKEEMNAFIKRYGSEGIYFHLPDMSEEDAVDIIKEANTKWGKI